MPRDIAEFISKVMEESHVPMAESVFGSSGVDAIFNIMRTLGQFYYHVEPNRIDGEVIIFQYVENRDIPTSRQIDFSVYANMEVNNLCIQIASNGLPYSFDIEGSSVEELAGLAVVYRLDNNKEEFLAGTEAKLVTRLDNSARSQFSVPSFSNLQEALQAYGVRSIRESTCRLFRQAWHDEKRYFFHAGPEDTIRDSLIQFLENTLGAKYDVWPEQKVNETDPVDIRVQTKYQNNRLMLIEIKWLGHSANIDGGVTARYQDPRARKGVGQLARYLDEQRITAPTRVIQGYYVIIDARREGLPTNANTERILSQANALYYENRSIDFQDDPLLERDDMDEPYRMYARPILG